MLRLERLQKPSNPLDCVCGWILNQEKLAVLPNYRHANRLLQPSIKSIERFWLIFGPGRWHEIEYKMKAAIRHHAELRVSIGIESGQRNDFSRFLHRYICSWPSHAPRFVHKPSTRNLASVLEQISDHPQEPDE